MHICIVCVCVKIYAWAQRSIISIHLSWWFGTLDLWAPCQLLSTRYFCRTLGSAAVMLTQSRGRQVGTTRPFLLCAFSLGIDARAARTYAFILYTYNVWIHYNVHLHAPSHICMRIYRNMLPIYVCAHATFIKVDGYIYNYIHHLKSYLCVSQFISVQRFCITSKPIFAKAKPSKTLSNKGSLIQIIKGCHNNHMILVAKLLLHVWYCFVQIRSLHWILRST